MKHSFLKQLRFRHYGAGIGVIILLITFYLIALQGFFVHEGKYDWQDFWQDDYAHQVIFFSFWQAFCSAILSLICGLLFARALFYQKFYGKNLILHLLSLTFVLPALIVILGLLGIYGHNGWLNHILASLGFSEKMNIYGFKGILLAHLFFNIPLATRMLLQSFHAIPPQQHQLAAQLGIRQWQFIRYIEWHYLKEQLLPVFSLIFMLCFTSFAIVLTLGGGPKYTTVEVAIYQALLFEFDFVKAGFFALLQTVICFVLFVLIQRKSHIIQTETHHRAYWCAKQTKSARAYQILLILFLTTFVFSPLLYIIQSGIVEGNWVASWQNDELWRALGYSLGIAPVSALLALLLAISLLILVRRLQWLYQFQLAQGILTFGMLILAVPMLVLATGLFLLLQSIEFSTALLPFILITCNAVASLPFVLRILAVPMHHNMQYYEKLAQSLGIKGWQRWRWIEWHNLKSPIAYAFALASCLSLGDFTAIALFGNQDFTSLPYLLYQQLGSYRYSEAAVTAIILLVCCIGLFFLAEGRHNHHKGLRND